jgi:hypothetical protein
MASLLEPIDAPTRVGALRSPAPAVRSLFSPACGTLVRRGTGCPQDWKNTTARTFGASWRAWSASGTTEN